MDEILIPFYVEVGYRMNAYLHDTKFMSMFSFPTFTCKTLSGHLCSGSIIGCRCRFRSKKTNARCPQGSWSWLEGLELGLGMSRDAG